MAIEAQCGQCGFKYGAPDSLAGKRVRCKRCGAVFALPAAGGSPAEEEWGGSLKEMEETANALSAIGPAMGGTGGRRRITEDDTIDSVLAGAHEAEGVSAAEAIRNTQVFDFPYSRETDKYLPAILVAISLGLVILQTLWSGDLPALDRGWVPVVRILLVGGLYALIVFPLAYLGVRHGVAKQKAHMPWWPMWKCFAAFTFPFALGYTMWLVGMNAPSLVLGWLAGLAVSLSAVWLLYRVRLERGYQPLIWGAAMFLVGAVISSAFVAGVNHTFHAVAAGSRTTHEYASSPIMPGLPWELGEAPVVEVPASDEPVKKVVVPVVDATVVETVKPQEGDEAVKTTGADGKTQAGGVGIIPNSTTVDGGMKGHAVEVKSEENNPIHDIPGLFDGTRGSSSPPAVAPLTEGNVNEITPRIRPQVKPPAGRVAAIEPSAFVLEVKPSGVPGGFDRVVWPLSSGESVLVVRRGEENDTVERWEGSAWKKTGERQARPESTSGESYAISSDGSLMASVATWPTLSVQVWSFDTGRVSQTLELDGSLGEASLLGFVSPSQLLVHWQRRGAHGLELWDLRTMRSSRVDMQGVETLEHNFALSGDGKWFAVAGRSQGGAAVSIYAVGQPRVVKQLPIRMLDARWVVQPSGLVFSPDGSEVAALFEKDGNALLCGWKMVTGRENPPLIYPAGALGGVGAKEAGRQLTWVNDGVWLLHGVDLIESPGGRVLGQTGFDRVLDQRMRGANQNMMVYVDDAGASQLAVVRFDAEKLPAKP